MQNFNVNLTVLVPTANTEVSSPARLDLKAILRHFLDFRFEVVRRRFEHADPGSEWPHWSGEPDQDVVAKLNALADNVG